MALFVELLKKNFNLYEGTLLKNIFFVLLVSLVIFNSPSNCQIDKQVETDIVHFFRTGGDLVNNFTSFEKPTPINFAVSLALIGGSYALDNNVKKFAEVNHSNLSDKIFSVDKIYGNEYTLIGIAGIYGYGLIFKNEDVHKIGLQTIEAVGYAGIITSVLKVVVGRSRPYTNEAHSMFRPFNFHAATTSFPSGHATVAFAMSTVLANNTNSLFLKILSYTAAGLVDCSRIYHNAHWFSDVVAGSAIGYFVGDFVSQEHSEKNTSIMYIPGGISLSIKF